jgi:hypothetical protein
MRTAKFSCRCRVCDRAIAAGDECGLHKQGGAWDSICGDCCQHIGDDARQRKLLYSIAAINGSDDLDNDLDHEDWRLLDEVFGGVDPLDPPAFVGGKHLPPVWARQPLTQ